MWCENDETFDSTCFYLLPQLPADVGGKLYLDKHAATTGWTAVCTPSYLATEEGGLVQFGHSDYHQTLFTLSVVHVFLLWTTLQG